MFKDYYCNPFFKTERLGRGKWKQTTLGRFSVPRTELDVNTYIIVKGLLLFII
jgi:hypothetical protein